MTRLLVLAVIMAMALPLSVLSESTDPAKTTAPVPGTQLQIATTGMTSTFAITAKDESGTPRTSGGDLFVVELVGPKSMSASVVDGLDGSYTTTFISTKAGTYDVSVMLAAAGGLSASYFENVWFFYTPVKTTVDPQINFDWGSGLLTPVGSDYVSVRWSGKIKPDKSEVYTFFVSSDDGSKLWVDNVQLIDRWDSSSNDTSATISLSGSALYSIKMEYKEITGDASVSLSWASASQQRQVIPGRVLYYETHIKSSPFALTINPGVICATMSTAAGPGLVTATAGGSAVFTLQANDAHVNPRGKGGDTLVVHAYPPSGAPSHGVVSDYSDSSYGSRYIPTVGPTASLFARVLELGSLPVTYYNTPWTTAAIDASTNQLTTQATSDGINLVLGGNIPVAASVANPFQARWEGLVKAPAAGEFTFRTRLAYNQERVRLWVDQSLLIDQWDTVDVSWALTRQALGVSLVTSKFYDFRVEYKVKDAANAKQLIVEWLHSGGTWTAIPTANLYTGQHISGSPFSVAVSAGSTCSVTSTATGHALSRATAGIPAVFTVTARDMYGNAKSIGRESFTATLIGATGNSGAVTDKGDGTYIVSYTPTKSGAYDLSVAFGASLVAQSPYTVTVDPGRRHISTSVATGNPLTLATAGGSTSVTLSVRDIHSNPQPAADWTPGSTTTPGMSFSLVPTAPITTTDPTCPGDCPDGASRSTVILRHTVTAAGSYKLHLNATSLHDGAVFGSPFQMTVLPNTACATTSIAFMTGASLSLATAGGEKSFVVQIRDAWGNPRNGPGMFDPAAGFIRQNPGTLDNGVGRTVSNGDGSSTTTFVSTQGGLHSVSASLVAAGGLHATYYDGDPWNTPTAPKITDVKDVDFSGTLGTDAHSQVGTNAFSVRWAGFVRAPYKERYTFTAILKGASKERLRLWIDNSLIIDGWLDLGGMTTLTGTAPTELYDANSYHDIVLDYSNKDAAAANLGLTLRWHSATHSISTLGTSDLFQGYAFSGSPFPMKVVSNSSCAGSSTVHGYASSLATAGVSNVFTLTVRDEFANPVDGTDDSKFFDFAVLTGSSLATTFADTSVKSQHSVNDGGSVLVDGATVTALGSNAAYIVTYTPTKTGAGAMRGMLYQPGGVNAVYFENPDLTDKPQQASSSNLATKYSVSRIDPTIDFAWGTGMPVTAAENTAKSKAIAADFFSARWTGMVKPEYSEVYTFHVAADEGARLWVDGLLVSSFWAQAIAQTSSYPVPFSRNEDMMGTIALLANKLYTIKLEYQEITGNASVSLGWSSKTRQRQIIPSTRLYYNATGSGPSNAGAPFMTEPGVACASKSSAAGPGITIATAGAAAVFTIQSRDSNANDRKLGDHPLYNVRVMQSTGTHAVDPVTPLTRLPGLTYPGGLTATYYDGGNFDGSIRGHGCVKDHWHKKPCAKGPWVDATDASLAWSFGSGVGAFPSSVAVTNNQFSARWSGFVRPSIAGTYTFHIAATDATNTAVVTVASASKTVTGTTDTLAVTFPTANEGYPLDITYAATGGGTNAMSLKWEFGGVAAQRVIHTDRLFPMAGRIQSTYVATKAGEFKVHAKLATHGGLLATFYDGMEHQHPRKNRVDETVMFDAAAESTLVVGKTRTVANLNLTDIQSYSARWEGLIAPERAAGNRYTFFLNTADPAQRAKLYIDNRVIIDRWDTYGVVTATQFSATSALSYATETMTDIKLEYQQQTGALGKLELRWECNFGICNPKSTIPSTHLFQGYHIINSPFQPFTIEPAPVCSTRSTVMGAALTSATAGITGSYVVTSTDAFNNERSVGGDNWVSRLHSQSTCTNCPPIVRGNITDLMDGGYAATFNATRAGPYTVLTSIATKGGVQATYYDIATVNGDAGSTQLLTTIDWSAGAGGAGRPTNIANEPWSARWQSFAQPPTAGEYTFHASVAVFQKERIRLWLDNSLVIDKWTTGSNTGLTMSGTYSFAQANALYDLELHYAQHVDDNRILKLEWEGADVAQSVIPSDRLWTRHDSTVSPTVTVTAAPSTALGTYATGTAVSTMTVGSTSVLTILSSDDFGNVRSAGKDNFGVRLMLGDDALALIPGQSNPLSGGSYKATVAPTVAGLYQMEVRKATLGGLNAEYFNNMWCSGEAVQTSVDPMVNHDWGMHDISPLGAGQANVTGPDHSSVRWTGWVKTAVSEVFTFTTATDDGVRLWLNESLVIDQWEASTQNFTATLNTVAGVFYDIKMEYREVTGNAYAKLLFGSQSVAHRLIPSTRLAHKYENIFGSPFAMRVHPGAIDPATDSTMASMMTAGHTNAFTIQTRDSYANKRSTWSDNLVVRLIPGAASVHGGASGKMGVLSNFVVPGQHKVVAMPTASGPSVVWSTLANAGGLWATYYKNTASQWAGGNVGVACWESSALTCEGNANNQDTLLDFSKDNTGNNIFYGLDTGSTHFSIRWHGYVRPTEAQKPYTFRLTMEHDTERVRMWIGDNIIINEWTSLSATAPVQIAEFDTAHRYYDINVDYKETGDQTSKINLHWQKDGSGWGVISSNDLYVAVHLSGSPFSVTVNPDVAVMSTTTLQGNGFSMGTAGIHATFMITARDAHGNARTKGGDKYVVQAVGGSGTSTTLDAKVTDLNDGAYLASYVPIDQGAYTLRVVLGTSMQTKSLMVEPGPTFGPNCLTNGDALTVSTAGVPATFSIVSRDTMKNQRSLEGTDKFQIRVYAPGAMVGSEAHNARVSYLGVGTYNLGKSQVSYRMSKSGRYTVDVKLASDPGLNADFYTDNALANKAASRVDASIQFDWGNTPAHIDLGIVDDWSGRWSGFVATDSVTGEYTFHTQVSTVSDRVRLWVDDHWIIDSWTSFHSSTTSISSTIPLMTETVYDIKMDYSNVGVGTTSKVILSWQFGGGGSTPVPSNRLFSNTTHIAGSPFDMTAHPHIACATMSTAHGIGMSLATSGMHSSFTIQSRDWLGNPRSLADDTFVVRAHPLGDQVAGLTISRHTLRDVHGTVTSLAGNMGKWAVAYTPTNKQNAGDLANIKGVQATYYNTGTVDGAPAASQTLLTVDWSGATGAAGRLPGVSTEPWSARWQSFVQPPTTGEYTFTAGIQVATKERVRLWIDNSAIIDQWTAAPSAATVISGTANIGSANTLYDLSLHYAQHVDDARSLKLSWIYGALPTAVVPSNRLFVSGSTNEMYHDLSVQLLHVGGLVATYFDTYADAWNTPKAHAVSTTLDWSTATKPAASTGPGFHVRWNGFIRPSTRSLYTFEVTTDAAASNDHLRMFVDNKLLIDTWKTHVTAPTATFDVPTANTFYDLRLDFFSQTDNGGLVRLKTECCGSGAKNVVPSDRLYQSFNISSQVSAGSGLAATYYDSNLNTRSPTFTRIDSTVDWSMPSVCQPSAGTSFSVKWAGFIRPSRTDLYTFYVDVEDTLVDVQLWIDDFRGTLDAPQPAGVGRVINAASPQASTNPISATFQFPRAHEFYDIVLHYSSTSVVKRAHKLRWENMGLSNQAYGVSALANETVSAQIVPSTRLFQRQTGSTMIRDDRAAWFTGATPAETCTATSNTLCRGYGHISNDVGRVLVAPGHACATTSSMDAAALKPGTAGVSATFAVTAKDAWGNLVDRNDDPFVGQARLATQTSAAKPWHTLFTSVPDTQNLKDPLGRYTCGYLITQSGTFSYAVGIAGAGKERGLDAAYFANPDLTGVSTSRLDQTINFDWGRDAPTTNGLIGRDGFSVRWTGYIKPEFSQLYTFFTRTDDGVRLWVDGTQLVDQWTTSRQEHYGTIQLVANVLYDIKMEYNDINETAFAELRYSSASTAKQIVPAKVLYAGQAMTSTGTINIDAAAVCATTSINYGAQLTISTAGIEATFTIQARDQYGNARSQSNAYTTAYQTVTRAVPQNQVTANGNCPRGEVTTGAAGTGQHLGHFTASIAREYSVYSSIGIGSPGTATGVWATYYDSADFKTPRWAVDRQEINWAGTALQAPRCLAADGLWSVRWEGFVKPTNHAVLHQEWTFRTVVAGNDERMRLWVDNTLLIDEWESIAATTKSATWVFPGGGPAGSANNLYDIKLEYSSTGAGTTSQIRLDFESGAVTPLAVIPSDLLYARYDVMGSPILCTVKPATLSAQKTLLSGVFLTSGTAGVSSSFKITVRDAYENIRTDGGDNIIVRVTPEGRDGVIAPNSMSPSIANGWTTGACATCPVHTRTSVVDNKDGTYDATAILSTSGDYNPIVSFATVGGLDATFYDTFTVASDQSAVGQAPIYYTRDVGAAGNRLLDFSDYKNAAITNLHFASRWTGLVRPSKALVYTFYAQLHNAASRVRLWLDNDMILNHWTSRPTSLEPSATFAFDAANGLYDISVAYRNQDAGSNGITIKWENTASGVDNDDVAKGVIRTDRLYFRDDIIVDMATNGLPYPAHLTIVAGETCATTSTATGTALTRASAGTQAEFTITAKDSMGNERAAFGPTHFAVQLYGQSGVPHVTATVAPGVLAVPQYRVRFTATVAKQYEVYSLLNNDLTGTGPDILTVNPDVICGSTSTATGGGLSAAVAHTTVALTITARDQYANQRTVSDQTAGTDMAVRITRTNNQGASPERWWDGSSATGGTDRSAGTLRGTIGTVTNALYPVTWQQDAAVAATTFLHASWATVGGLFATYYFSAVPQNYASNPNNIASVQPAANKQYTTVSETRASGADGGNAGAFDGFFAAAGSGTVVRWTGLLRPTTAGEYTFQLINDATSLNERFRLWVDNKLMIDQWTSLAAINQRTATINVPVPDAFYDVNIEYHTTPGGDNRAMELRWAWQQNPALIVVASDFIYTRYDISGSPFPIQVAA